MRIFLHSLCCLLTTLLYFPNMGHANPTNKRVTSIQRAEFSVSLWPKQHKMFVTAKVFVKASKNLKQLRIFLPQVIHLEQIQIRQGAWKNIPFKRQLETATIPLSSKNPRLFWLKIKYTITFHSKKNYLFRAIFCRIDPAETYFLYGWYPSLHPFADPLSGRLLKGNRFPYTLQLEVPFGQTALASGPLVRKTKQKNGRILFIYRQSAIKEAAIFFSVAPLRKITKKPKAGVQIDFYIRPQDGVKNLKVLGKLAVKAEQFYRKLWGPPTALQRRPIRWRLISFGGSGARGYPFTLLLDRAQGYFQRPLKEHVDRLFTRRQVLLHEMAHTWWGNAVTGSGKGSIWLNEGMANYASIRAIGALYGKVAENLAIRRHIRYFLKGKGRGGLLDPGGLAQMIQRTAYTKGALVFFELERHIGRPAVDRGLRLYFQTHRGKFTTVKALQKSLERAAKRSLQTFFQDWIYGRELPFVQLKRWTCQKSTQKGCKLSLLLQNQGKIASDAHIRVRFHKNQSKDLVVRVPAGKTLRHHLQLSNPPQKILLDPDGTMLHGFRVKALFTFANRLRRSGQLKRAKPIFLKIIRAFPAHGHAHYSLGLLLQKQALHKRALKHFGLATKSKPSTLTPYWVPLWSHFRIAALLQKIGKNKKAKRLFQALLKQPQNPYNLKARIRSTMRNK